MKKLLFAIILSIILILSVTVFFKSDKDIKYSSDVIYDNLNGDLSTVDLEDFLSSLDNLTVKEIKSNYDISLGELTKYGNEITEILDLGGVYYNNPDYLKFKMLYSISLYKSSLISEKVISEGIEIVPNVNERYFSQHFINCKEYFLTTDYENVFIGLEVPACLS